MQVDDILYQVWCVLHDTCMTSASVVAHRVMIMYLAMNTEAVLYGAGGFA